MRAMSWVLFGANEDCHPGDSSSENCEKLLQRGSGEKVNIQDFGERGVQGNQIKRFSANHEQLMSPWRDLCFSKYERNKGWKHEICSWKYPRKLFHQFPWRTSASFSNLNSLRACQMSTVTVAQDLISADWLVSITQSCPTLCNPMNCSLPGSSLHGILQARVLEWVAISFSRGSSWLRDQTQVSRTTGRLFT